MRKGIRNFCNGDGSTSTLDQLLHKSTDFSTLDHHQHHNHDSDGGNFSSPNNSIKTKDINTEDSSQQWQQQQQQQEENITLEQMIMQLELEEEIARKAKQPDNIDCHLHDYTYNIKGNSRSGAYMKGRMSCVNNSDILRSARNALNQYPRFSLDGKDAMYRSSFRNNILGSSLVAAAAAATAGDLQPDQSRESVCCDHEVQRRERIRTSKNYMYGNKLGGGELGEVVWCKPGVVAKLMGLEAIPVPIICNSSRSHNTVKKQRLISPLVKRHNLIRRSGAETASHEMERRRPLHIDGDHCQVGMLKRYSSSAGTSSLTAGRPWPMAACSSKAASGSRTPGCRVMKPVLVQVEPAADDGGGGGWNTQHFRF